jgi:hypothetical protein
VNDKLPEKVKRLDFLRVERGMKKLCNCLDPRFEIDYSNRLIYCKCGALVDPFDALYEVARHYERMAEYTEYMLRTRQEIDNYKPHLVVIKELEKHYRGSKLWPTCPICKGAFDLKELINTGWIHPDYANRG